MIEQSAKGKANAQTSIKHKRALPSHERLKFRQRPAPSAASESTKLLENKPHIPEDASSSEDEQEELRAELERLKRNKAKIAPPKPVIAKKSWRRETPFQPQKQTQLQTKTTVHVNDSIRNKKHRDFLDDYIRP